MAVNASPSAGTSSMQFVLGHSAGDRIVKPVSGISIPGRETPAQRIDRANKQENVRDE